MSLKLSPITGTSSTAGFGDDGPTLNGLLAHASFARLDTISSDSGVWPYRGLEGLLLAQAESAETRIKCLGTSDQAGDQSVGHPLMLIGAVSRMTHQIVITAAEFDAPLPLTRPAGVESLAS